MANSDTFRAKDVLNRLLLEFETSANESPTIVRLKSHKPSEIAKLIRLIGEKLRTTLPPSDRNTLLKLPALLLKDRKDKKRVEDLALPVASRLRQALKAEAQKHERAHKEGLLKKIPPARIKAITGENLELLEWATFGILVPFPDPESGDVLRFEDLLLLLGITLANPVPTKTEIQNIIIKIKAID